MSGKYGGLDQATAESLLNGGSGQSAREERLSALLTAASGPVTGDELAGEHTAMTAFTRARRRRGAGTNRRLRARLAKLLASKTAAVAVIGSVAAGGAFATGGSLPIPFNGPSSGGAVVTPSTPVTESPGTATPGTEDEAEEGGPTETPTSPDATPTPTPTALPTGTPTPGVPDAEPTEPTVPPTSSPAPSHEPTEPGTDGPPTERDAEDPDSSSAAELPRG
jgi:hypothetical protein